MQPLAKTAILTLVIVSVAVISWELYLRNKGILKSYDDGPALWAEKRGKVYESPENATVFIGSSRIKYDLDIKTWQAITGEKAIQLAEEGSSPMLVLEDLANDEKFKGKLIVDITEPLFFSPFAPRDAETLKNISFYKDRTPAQRASFALNSLLESKLIFLDKDFLSLNAMLDELQVPDRKGVSTLPMFPMDFAWTSADRQAGMTPKFLADTTLQNKVKAIWSSFIERGKSMPPLPDAAIIATLNRAKALTDKIKARGGRVLFVRTPASGPMGVGENMGFPREKFWNRLLSVTECPGIHYMDHPAIAHFDCPEWSHLSPRDAAIFTRHFIDILEKEKGWKFPGKAGN